jgi:hypothetical protein
MVCSNISNQLIRNYIKLLFPDISFTNPSTNKSTFCNDIEIGFMRKNAKDKMISFMNPEEFLYMIK